MTTILFVDEDKDALDDIQRLVFATQVPWTPKYASTPEEALAACEAREFDVVVAQLEMIAMDGRELLRQIKNSFPDSVRIIVSNKKNPMAIIGSAAVAHRFIVKPYDPRQIEVMVKPLVQLQSELSVEKLRKEFDQLDLLPTPPQHIVDLNRELSTAEPSIDRVAGLVTEDPSLSAKILQLVNSAYYGLSNKLSDIRHATAYLGLNAMRDLAVAVELETRTQHASPEINKMVDVIQAHSRTVSQIAVEFFNSASEKQDAFTAGLLHDAGLLALASIDTEKFRKAYELKTAAHCIDSIDSLPEAETNLIGTSHASLGAYLLRNWGLPSHIIEAVAWHHNSVALANEEFSLAHAVHIADQICMQNERADDREIMCRLSEDDLVDSFGIGDVVEKYRHNDDAPLKYGPQDSKE